MKACATPSWAELTLARGSPTPILTRVGEPLPSRTVNVLVNTRRLPTSGSARVENPGVAASRSSESAFSFSCWAAVSPLSGASARKSSGRLVLVAWPGTTTYMRLELELKGRLRI